MNLKVYPGAGALVLCSFVVAAAEQPQKKEMPPDQKAAMEAMMKAASPGDAHKKLASFVGNWDALVKTWMQPGAPPILRSIVTSFSAVATNFAGVPLAFAFISTLGSLGLVTIGEKGGEVFLGASLQELGSVGPETLNIIDNETERLVRNAEARAAYVLDRNWSTVEETAAALLEQETLSGVALDALLSTVQEVSIEDLLEIKKDAPPRFTERQPKGPA